MSILPRSLIYNEARTTLRSCSALKNCCSEGQILIKNIIVYTVIMKEIQVSRFSCEYIGMGGLQKNEKGAPAYLKSGQVEGVFLLNFLAQVCRDFFMMRPNSFSFTGKN